MIFIFYMYLLGGVLFIIRHQESMIQGAKKSGVSNLTILVFLIKTLFIYPYYIIQLYKNKK